MTCSFYPGKPQEIMSTSSLFLEKSQDPKWVAEPKWNGWRLFAISDRNQTYAFNSKGDHLSYFDDKSLTLPPDTFLDCEWVDRRTTNTKNLIVVFGVLQYRGLLLEGHSEFEQRKFLEHIFEHQEVISNKYTICLVERYGDKFLEHFQILKNDSTIEGLVLKNTASKIEISRFHQFKTHNQLKVKK